MDDSARPRLDPPRPNYAAWKSKGIAYEAWGDPDVVEAAMREHPPDEMGWVVTMAPRP